MGISSPSSSSSWIRDFVSLLMLCLSTVSYSLLLNGGKFGSIRPSRGLRQGDPLSPFLFICVVEAFIGLITRAVDSGELRGVRIAPLAPVISHLCFADDTLLFCHASMENATTLKLLLDVYAEASGQFINLDKSSLVFSPRTPDYLRHSISSSLAIPVVSAHEKYLGLPAKMGRSRRHLFAYLRDRVWKRIEGYGERHLSRAGKAVLIKSVLTAIPTYVMSCVLLPKSLLDQIDSAIRRFWWGGKNGRGLAWISWLRLCRPKKEGGLGFRDLHSFNLALLAKQGWRLLNQPHSLLASVLKAKYYQDCSFLEARIGSRPSSTWRSIFLARPYLQQGLRRRIGNGVSTERWGDPWLPDVGHFRI